MPPSDRFYDLVHRRLAAEATPDERRELDALLAADPALAARFIALEETWHDSAGIARARGFDVDGAWAKLKSQLAPSAKAPAVHRAFLVRHAWLGAAAALVVVGLSAWWLAKRSIPAALGPVVQEVVWDTYESSGNPLTVVVLGDGTRVHLSKQSRLRYPKTPLPDRREVFLEGEAFFEVSTNPHRPFLVHAPGLVTTVLGTTFNIRAFRDETTRAVSLLTGSIDVARTGVASAGDARSRLAPGQQLRFDSQKPGHEIRPIDAAAATGWMRDRLVFQDEPLESLARALTRKFDVETRFADHGLRLIPISADFRGQDLQTILDLVTLTTGAHCELQPKQGNAPAVVTFRASSPR